MSGKRVIDKWGKNQEKAPRRNMSLTKRKSQEATGNEKIKIKTEAKKGTKWKERRKRKEKRTVFTLVLFI